MNPDHILALADFGQAIANENQDVSAYAALEKLTQAVVGVKLFTVMEADMEAGISRRSYSSDPKSYPVSGSKPINRTHWFDIVHVERRPFVANTIAEIATVFPDHDQIWSLGCGSVVNLPIFIAGEFMGTVNLLHEELFYNPERVKQVTDMLQVPSMLALMTVRHLRVDSKT
ncbi:GAF domain-containing protein [Agrobacterium sp. SORGH_AS 787]|uniref:GAF domain-containing protein n=1 Tax=Agrobacterium sp. SORGH_AS 787 TaxID=3041775 RepID=UPI00277D8016|nr:hypothetical protein [Rhizobium sp. SORGH_AS_0787]